MATQQIHQWIDTLSGLSWLKPIDILRAKQPWALAKTDPARQKTVLYVTAEVIRQIAILAHSRSCRSLIGKITGQRSRCGEGCA